MTINAIGLSLLMATALALAGCATPTLVTLQNGTQYLTKDRPNTTTLDGYYEFIDIAGNRIRVKASDVATIKAED